MTRNEALAILTAHRRDLENRGVAHAALFGSTARGEARPESDVDVLVDLDPAVRIGVFEFVAIQEYVGELFEGPVDVVLGRALAPAPKASARKDLIYAF